LKILIKDLEDIQIKRRELIMELNDNTINKVIRVERIAGETRMSLLELIYIILDHEAHHRGELSAYLRMIKGD
jgi:uncharacterized damage-inducible protein DinB